MANDVNNIPKAITKPPKTAVRRVDLRRQSAITTDAEINETDQLIAPIQPENCCKLINYFKICLSRFR